MQISAEPNRVFHVCHVAHPHDRVYAENVCEYFEQVGVPYNVVEFEAPGERPELRQCLNADALGILGINSQLDHCWFGDDNFVAAAARRHVPVIHWILDHPSSRWPEFAHATAANSRFLFTSPSAEGYFRRYCLADARTGCTASVGQNWRSRLEGWSPEQFHRRENNCLIALNLKRVGGTGADALGRLQTLQPDLGEAVREAIEQARLDLTGPLETHLVAALARRGHDLTDRDFHFCFQIVDDTTQVWRRTRIFDVASRFPVLIQTDSVPDNPGLDVVATFINDRWLCSMPATIARMRSSRSVLDSTYTSSMLHDRTTNGLNAGCVVIVEDTPAHRRVFANGDNALFFRYDDDSLAQCLDVVCNQPVRAGEIAQAGFSLRDDPAIRFAGFENILALARP
jgi:hypothetical protein